MIGQVYKTPEDTGYGIFIAMQPFTVEMIQDSCTALHDIRQQELYYSHSH